MSYSHIHALRPVFVRRTVAFMALAVASVSGCGSSNGSDGEAATAPGSEAADRPARTEAAAEMASDEAAALDLTHSGGTATVTIEGWGTYSFGTVDGEISVCTNMFGSFQVALPLLDEDGAAVDSSELTFELIEPGSLADTEGENTASFEVTVAGDTFAAGDSGLARMMGVETPPLELAPGDRAASGTVNAVHVLGGELVEITFEAACG